MKNTSIKKTLFTALAFICLLCQMAFGTNLPNKKASNLTNGEYGFIENKGQIMDQNGVFNSGVNFILCSGSFNTHLKKSGFSYEVKEVVRPAELNKFMENANELKNLHQKRELDLQTKIKVHRIDVEFVGCNPSPEILTQVPSQDYINYYTTITVPNGALSVNHFRKVIYKNIYNNIDVEYEIAEGNQVKYNFVIHPGGKISDIKLKYKGASELNLNKNVLNIKTSIREINDQIPYSYLKAGGADKKVEVRFVSLGNETFSFETNCDHANATLVIDPLPNVQWGTYYGGTSGDYCMGVTLDPMGNSTLCGDARSLTNIATTGAHQVTYAGGGDCFMAKFNSAGVRQWATYYGGSGWDGATAITNDAAGNVYLNAWVTGPTVFATPGCHQPNYGGGPWDALACKFSPAGVRIWSTYFGGSMDDEGWGIVVDNLNNVIITGNTESSNNIASAGAHQTTYGGGSDDAFLAKFDQNGVRLWGTYYGGTGTECDWYKSGVVVDNANNVILATWSNSANGANIIATPGAYQTNNSGNSDAVLVKFSPAGVRQWGTYYGGTSQDVAYGVACDPFDNITFVGHTSSNSGIATAGSHQTTLGGGQDAFIAKFTPGGARVWGTYFGGTGSEQAYNIDNVCSQLVVLGMTTSNSGIAFGTGLHQATLGGGQDAFVTQFSDVNGTVVWSTYYGGAATESAYWYEVNISSNTTTGEFVIAGNTNSNNNIAYGVPHQATMAGTGNHAFVAKFDGLQSFSLTSTVSNVKCFGGNTGSATVNIVGNATNPVTYSWTPAGPNASVSPNLIAGNYSVMATDFNGCKGTTTLTITQPSSAVGVSITSVTDVSCFGSTNGSISAIANGGSPSYTYAWQPVPSSAPSINSLPKGTYTLTVTDASLCTVTTTVSVNEPGAITLSIQSTAFICQGSSNGTANVIVAGGVPAFTYNWSVAGGTGASVAGLQSGIHTVTVTDSKLCSSSQSFSVGVMNLPVVKVESESSICQGANTGSASVSVSGGNPGYSIQWQPIGGNQLSATGLNTGVYSVFASDANGCVGNINVNIKQLPVTHVNITSDKLSGCAPFCTNFSFQSTAQLKNYYWNASVPGGVSQGANFSYCLNEPGTANTFMTFVDINNCSYTSTPVMVEAYPIPTADFHIASNSIIVEDEVELQNTSSSSMGETYEWFFNDPAIPNTTEKDPRVKHNNVGSYQITLVVTNNKGCSNSKIKQIYIEEQFNLYVPNAFTPNDDGLNDVFKPKGTGLISYELLVFDRWGELLFKSNDLENGWDGTKKGNGEILKDDTYIWKISVTPNEGKHRTLNGTVSLLK